jgi:hypothetical protein
VVDRHEGVEDPLDGDGVELPVELPRGLSDRLVDRLGHDLYLRTVLQQESVRSSLRLRSNGGRGGRGRHGGPATADVRRLVERADVVDGDVGPPTPSSPDGRGIRGRGECLKELRLSSMTRHESGSPQADDRTGSQDTI